MLNLSSYQTAWLMLHKIRKAMAFENRYKLGGIVEVDESYIGSGEKYGKRGRGAKNKILVLCKVDNWSKTASMKPTILLLKYVITPDYPITSVG